jgi:hypothetical protein
MPNKINIAPHLTKMAIGFHPYFPPPELSFVFVEPHFSPRLVTSCLTVIVPNLISV